MPARSTSAFESNNRPDLSGLQFTQTSSSSPDGKWKAEGLLAIAYGDAPADYARVTLTNSDGSLNWTPYAEWSETGLGDSTLSYFYWSADGRYLYFTHSGASDGGGYPFTAELHQVDLADGSLSQIPLAGNLSGEISLSPRVDRMAFRVSEGIQLAELPGGNSHTLPYAWPAGFGYLVDWNAWSPDGGELALFTGGDEGLTCCDYFGGAHWSADSSSIYGVATTYDSSYRFGVLWKVDSASSAVESLTRTPTADGRFSMVIEPYLAPDGYLYGFAGSYQADSGYLDAPVISLVRSAPNWVTGQTVLRSDNFVLMGEALWSPDASKVIVSSVPARSRIQNGGVLKLYYADGQRSSVWLAPAGYQLKWGP